MGTAPGGKVYAGCTDWWHVEVLAASCDVTHADADEAVTRTRTGVEVDEVACRRARACGARGPVLCPLLGRIATRGRH